MKTETVKSAPLSSATLHILLALAGGNLHGYGIIKEVVRSSNGHYRLGPGTLYDNLKKLMTAGLVADAPPAKGKSAAVKDDDRSPLANHFAVAVGVMMHGRSWFESVGMR